MALANGSVGQLRTFEPRHLSRVAERARRSAGPRGCRSDFTGPGGGAVAANGRYRPRLCENRTRALVVPRSRSLWPPSIPESPKYAAQTGNREHFLGIWVTAAGFSHSLDPKKTSAPVAQPTVFLSKASILTTASWIRSATPAREFNRRKRKLRQGLHSDAQSG